MAKAERKNRTRAEVDEVIEWRTGYDAAGPEKVLADKVDLEILFARAPASARTRRASRA